MPTILTLAEAAEYLRISRATMYKLIHENKIPVAKVGSRWRFRKEDLDEWLRGKTVNVSQSNGEGDSGKESESKKARKKRKRRR